MHYVTSRPCTRPVRDYPLVSFSMLRSAEATRCKGTSLALTRANSAASASWYVPLFPHRTYFACDADV